MSLSPRHNHDIPQRRRRRQRSTHPLIVQTIQTLRRQGKTAGEIETAIGLDERFAGLHHPHRRTIEDIAAEVTPLDPGEEWAPFATMDVDAMPIVDVGAVLDVLAAKIADTEGRARIANREASWIAQLRRAVPDLPPSAAYHLAVTYLARRQRDRETRDLDAFLAFAPWRGREAFDRYEAAIANSWIEPAPWLGGDLFAWATEEEARSMLEATFRRLGLSEGQAYVAARIERLHQEEEDTR